MAVDVSVMSARPEDALWQDVGDRFNNLLATDDVVRKGEVFEGLRVIDTVGALAVENGYVEKVEYLKDIAAARMNVLGANEAGKIKPPLKSNEITKIEKDYRTILAELVSMKRPS